MLEPREFTHSLPWLHGKLKLDNEINLFYLLCDLRSGSFEQYYHKWRKGDRLIYQPKNPLKLVQQRISEQILSKLPRPEASFGFSGGSCKQAAEEHKNFDSVLMLDLRDAFSQVTHNDVFQSLRACPAPAEPLSFYVSRMIADLCTVEVRWSSFLPGSYGGFLPQGPSTSPRLFDLALTSMDNELLRWGRRRNFTYTRYADNLYFSSRHPEFPPKSRAIILTEVGKKFRYHKVRQIDHGSICRMLGLNVSPGLISNTRDFKRSFRGALHHLEHALNNCLPYEEAWAVAKGYWGFAVKETLSEALRAKFESLKQRIHLLEWGW